MKEKGSETLSGVLLKGLAVLLRDSNAAIKSTQPAGRFTLNVSMNSLPNIAISSRSNSTSTPCNTPSITPHGTGTNNLTMLFYTLTILLFVRSPDVVEVGRPYKVLLCRIKYNVRNDDMTI